MKTLLILGTLCLAASSASATTANDICAPNANPCFITGGVTVTPGSTLDFGSRQLDVRPSGSLTVNGGVLTILAGSVRLESHAQLIGLFAQNTAASIKVTTTGDIRVETGANGLARVKVSDTDIPGQIDLVAGGNVTIDGDLEADGTAGDSVGGVINVTASGNVSLGATSMVTARGGGTFGLGGSITVLAGGTYTSSGIIKADAADGGDIDIETQSGDATVAGDINASAGGSFGDGGFLTLLGAHNLSVTGNVLLQGAGSELEGGGTGGDIDLEATSGTINLSGDLDNHGAAPDGDGGDVDAFAGLDFILTGNLLNQGGGIDSCGGFMSMDAGRLFNIVGDIEISGGFCGGDILASGATAQLASTSLIAGDGAYFGGSLDLIAEQITAAGKIHLNGTGAEGFPGSGGFIQLAGCTINVPQDAIMRTDGEMGQNLIQASGQLTIGAQTVLSSKPSGTNRFEYRDPTKPPIIAGSASIQPTQDCAPAKGCLTPTLPACATAAVCGNGIIEAGEGCDDGNTLACDGCSPTCRAEFCGNGTIECGEECDDGPSNGGPGDPCDASCHVIQGTDTIFVPSSHRGRGCMLEWAIRNPAVSGFPPSSITCIDGDPACDGDGATNGSCTFRVSACLNVTDVRIPSCEPAAVEFIKLRRPSPTDPNDDVEAANAQPLLDAVKALGVTVRSGTTVLQEGTPESRADRCTATVSQIVPHPQGATGRRLLAARAGDTAGHTVSNRVALGCAPNPAVCGNGIKEISEQCDDGNTVGCDGCSENCRIERCGDGIVQCGEQCDDGVSNGQPGDPCSASCTEVPPPNRIPGGRSSHDCLAEWSLATDTLATSRSGLPANKQVCVDNTACDFDPTPNTCEFHLWTCLGGEDTRIGCVADSVATLNLLKPTASQTSPPAVAARQTLLERFGQILLPAGPGEVCSPRIDLHLPAGKAKLALKDEAVSQTGIRDRDSLKLICAPAP